MTTRAGGSFEVKVTPVAPDGKYEDATRGRLTIDKTFQGDLAGTSVGQMLTALSAVKGSAGYVAIEHVTGTLHGRTGAFSLQHSSTMHRGEPTQSIVVVPDSGTGELVGLTGTMKINIVEKKHFYEFDYDVDERPRG
jgi:hypothetical protein